MTKNAIKVCQRASDVRRCFANIHVFRLAKPAERRHFRHALIQLGIVANYAATEFGRNSAGRKV
jgi:hypothetical protein